MVHNDRSTTRGGRQHTFLLAGTLALSLTLCWTQWRALASTRSTVDSSLVQLQTMSDDAQRILTLQKSPQSAVGQARTSQELLHQVERALSSANIDRSLWSDSVPQAAVRLPGTDYQRAGVRLYFGGLTLQQLTGFAYRLHLDDPTLGVSALNLINRDQESAKFDVDVMVSYLVFAPKVAEP